jgi:hypothetical protein
MTIFDNVNWNVVGSMGSAISAFAAVIVLFITGRGLIAESRRARASFHQSFLMNSANMITAFENTYYGERGTNDRIKASKTILKIRRKNKGEKLENNSEIFDLYDAGLENFSLFSIFENIGYLTRIGVLDKDMVYENFFWEIEKYYISITKPHNLLVSTRIKEQFPALFKEFEWLYQNLLEEDSKENRRINSACNLTESQIDDFLKKECDAQNNRTR